MFLCHGMPCHATPYAFEEVALGARATTLSTTLTTAAVHHLLDAERLVNNLAYLCVCAHTCVLGDAPMVLKAKIAGLLREACAPASKAIESSPPALREAALRQTMPFLRQWVAVANVYSELMVDCVLETAAQSVAEATTAVDARCPRWGEVISDHGIRDDAAQMQLVMNSNIASLPGHIRTLHGHMKNMCLVGTILNVSLDELAITKEIVRSGRNSLDFGKKTVNVAAGVRTLFQKEANAATVQQVLRLRHSLPQALIVRLEALLPEPLADDDDDVEEAPAQTTTSTTTTTATARPSAPGPPSGSSRRGKAKRPPNFDLSSPTMPNEKRRRPQQ